MAGHVIWSGLESAATLAQLVGVDAGGLITKIKEAALTAHQNRIECEHLAGRVQMIAELLPLVQDPEAMRPLAGLGCALREAHDLVQSCQGRGRTYRFFTASRQAERFRNVQSRIDSFLAVFPVISHIGITRRLDSGSGSHPAMSRAHSSQPADPQLGPARFSLPEITKATGNFAAELGEGDSGTVYKGRLRDGREVAVKRLRDGLRCAEDTFGTELAILHPLSHDHVVRLLGSCAEEGQRLLVYDHADNGTLRDQLNNASPAAPCWKTRRRRAAGRGARRRAPAPPRRAAAHPLQRHLLQHPPRPELDAAPVRLRRVGLAGAGRGLPGSGRHPDVRVRRPGVLQHGPSETGDGPVQPRRGDAGGVDGEPAGGIRLGRDEQADDRRDVGVVGATENRGRATRRRA